MKRSLSALAVCTLLAGCFGSAPQSASEMRALSGSNVLGSQSSVKVARSYGAVVANVRRGAEKCLNRTQQLRTTSSPGPGMAPVTSTMNFYYTASVKSGSGGTEVLMRKRFEGAKLIGGGPDNSGIFYLIDVKPASGGTVLHLYGGKMGYGELNSAVKQWANGGPIRCPELP